MPSLSKEKLKQTDLDKTQSISDPMPSTSKDFDKHVFPSTSANGLGTDVNEESAPTLLQMSKTAPEDDLTEKIWRQNMDCSTNSLRKSEKQAQYVTKLTYKGHKAGQGQSADSIAKEYYEARLQSSSSKSNDESDPGSKNVKLFNPFPSRLVNKNRTQNGIRLGLYSAESSPSAETVTQRSLPASKSAISRAQINACLHRQYMADVRQQAKSKR